MAGDARVELRLRAVARTTSRSNRPALTWVSGTGAPSPLLDRGLSVDSTVPAVYPCGSHGHDQLSRPDVALGVSDEEPTVNNASRFTRPSLKSSARKRSLLTRRSL